MATNTAATSARQYHQQMVHFLRKRITFADAGTTVTVGTIPAGASVIGGGVHIVTAFNGGGTDLLDVGFVGGTTDADGYATLLELAAVGYIVLDELAATTNIQQSVDTTVTCLYTDSSSNSTAGAADVIVMFVPDIDQ